MRLQLVARFAETALAGVVAEYNLQQVILAKVGPHFIHEEEFGIGNLPEQEIAHAALATSANQDVGVGHIASSQQ